MKADLIRKNTRLTQFSGIRELVIAKKVNPLPKNQKPKDNNRQILEFFSS